MASGYRDSDQDSFAFVEAAARVMWDESGYFVVESAGVSPHDSIARAGEHHDEPTVASLTEKAAA